MAAFIGIGVQELILLGFLAAIGIGIAVVILVVSRSASKGRSHLEALEDENRRLRDELDRRHDKP